MYKFTVIIWSTENLIHIQTQSSRRLIIKPKYVRENGCKTSREDGLRSGNQQRGAEKHTMLHKTYSSYYLSAGLRDFLKVGTAWALNFKDFVHMMFYV